MSHDIYIKVKKKKHKKTSHNLESHHHAEEQKWETQKTVNICFVMRTKQTNDEAN